MLISGYAMVDPTGSNSFVPLPNGVVQERAIWTPDNDPERSMIRHTVAFRLKHKPGSPGEAAFLSDAKRILGAIPNVENLEQLRQISGKNAYTFGFSMDFANQAAYDRYNEHPDHVAFVRDRWLPEVEDFLEIDYIPL